MGNTWEVGPPTGVLSDRSIQELGQKSVILPFNSEQVQPSSYDVRLSPHFRVFQGHRYQCIDPATKQPGLTEAVSLERDTDFVLHPGEFVLGSTIEALYLPSDIVARIEGKSSLGRIGLLVHATAGFVDPGFYGCLTLELSNQTRLPIILRAEMLIGQVSFQYLDEPAEKPYKGKYQGATGPAASKIHEDFEVSGVERKERLRARQDAVRGKKS